MYLLWQIELGRVGVSSLFRIKVTWREGFFELLLSETSDVRKINSNEHSIISVPSLGDLVFREMVIQDYLGDCCESLAFNGI